MYFRIFKRIQKDKASMSTRVFVKAVIVVTVAFDRHIFSHG